MTDDEPYDDGGITTYGADGDVENDGNGDDVEIPVYGGGADDGDADAEDDDDDFEIPVYGDGSDDDDADDDDGDFEIPVYGETTEESSVAHDPIAVGVAEYAVTDRPRPLTTSGLGSCLGVVVRDEVADVSGLLHFMLPAAGESNGRHHPDAKFADTGIAALIAELEAVGGDPERSWAKLAGGASMVAFSKNDRSVGERNAEAARRALTEHGVEVVAEQLGGTVGRSIEFDPASGELAVRTSGDGESSV